MFDYLISHARKNVWCTPNQDNSLIFKLPRITGMNGVINTITVGHERIDLPKRALRFHVYQIGGIALKLLNLYGSEGVWNTLAQSCNEGENLIDCYHTSGVEYPRSQVWSIVTQSGCVLIAVPRLSKVDIDFNSLEIFLRVYSNAFFDSDRANTTPNYVEVKGKTILSSDDLIELQIFYSQCVAKGYGHTAAYVNGYRVPAMNGLYANVGDVAEVLYDSSIYKQVEFAVDNLATFESTLDSKAKYILHYEGQYNQSIDYVDDIDLYLLNTTTGKGVFMHKNAKDAVRMLTHRDYAVPVAYVDAWAQKLKSEDGSLKLSDLKILLLVRKSGYVRPLIHEHHRIKELYELSEEDFMLALTGIDSNVSVWNAASLEESAYPLVMRSREKDLSRQMVQDAYGYHGVATIIADTPIKRDMTRSLLDAPVPYLLAYDSTVTEYDEAGLLIASHRHTNGFTYQPRSENCRYLEMLAGEGSTAIDDQYGQTAVYNPLLNYRFYVGTPPVEGGKPVWEDVTGSTLYSINFSTNTITWAAEAGSTHVVRSDKRFLQYDKLVSLNDGTIMFSIEQAKVTGGAVVMAPMDIPMGEFDLFMNGRSLIEGLDYIVKFPDVVVCNRQYLVNPQSEKQKFTLRHTGFCSKDLKRTEPNEFGFVQHGKISRNGRYNLHEGRVQRVNCAGRIYCREELKFNETSLNYQFDDALNGEPYQIRDIVVPMRGLVNEDTYSFRSKSLEVDEEISDYLTLKLPEAVETEPNPISRPYSLYSPFICKVLYALVRDEIDERAISNHYDDQKVRDLVAPYLYLLDYDPINISRDKIDRQYVIIQPHFLQNVVDVNLNRYRFMVRLVELYGQGRVNLSSLLRISE